MSASLSIHITTWMVVLFVFIFSLSTSYSESKVYDEQHFHQKGSYENELSASSLKWAVVYDTRHVNMTNPQFLQILHRFINTTLDINGKQLFANTPMLINSHGDVLNALTSITSMMLNSSNYSIPDVLFLMENTDVSTEVSNLFKKSNLTRNVVIISAFTSNTEVCDSGINPFTICMPPRDMINVRALLEVGALKLNWHSIAMIYENNDYGRGVESSVSEMLQQATNTPTVVHEAYMNEESSIEEEDALVKSILVEEPRAIVCFVNADELVRLRDAFARVAIQTNRPDSEKVFLLGSKEAINVLPNLAFASDATAWWGALLVPNYTSVQEMQNLGIADTLTKTKTNTENGVEWDDYLAMTLSFLFDGMQMVSRAHGVSSLENLRNVHFTGFTGLVAFDPVYHQRIPCIFVLITQNYSISRPLLTWTMESYSALPQINVLQKDIIDEHERIPPSPLRSVTVCMTSPSSCADVQMLSAMLYKFLEHNVALSELSIENNNVNVNKKSQISVRPIAINTGDSGISGLSTLIPIARGCTVVTGPGRSSIALALTPVINEFQLTQIDYNSASDFFTTQPGSYPFFVRTTPSDSYKFAAYGEMCDHFAWERAIIISTRDQVGSSRAQSLATAMLHHNIHVEQMYVLDNASEAAIQSVLKTIYDKDVSRIIFVEIATVSGNEADAFFNLSDTLTFMHNYVFFLSSDLCLHGYTSPRSRAKLQSSICIYSYVDPTVLQTFNTELQQKPQLYTSLQTVLSDGGFVSQAQLCNLTQIPPFAGFAVDAGSVVIEAVSNAIHDNVSLSTSSNLLQYTRNHHFSGFTGDFTIDMNGNRVDASFSIDIQISDKLLVIGTWNDLQMPKLRILYNEPFMWMTNSTDIPLDTFRDISFVISNTLTASPGAIVLSVLGFIGTITVFFFWYRHYKVQKMIELTLEGNEIPVTEEELQRLRGEFRYND